MCVDVRAASDEHFSNLQTATRSGNRGAERRSTVIAAVVVGARVGSSIQQQPNENSIPLLYSLFEGRCFDTPSHSEAINIDTFCCEGARHIKLAESCCAHKKLDGEDFYRRRLCVDQALNCRKSPAPNDPLEEFVDF